MNLLLDPTLFKVTMRRVDDKLLSNYWVQPTVFTQLLNPESSMLAAPRGYGKSTLAIVAQQQMQQLWLNISLEEIENSSDDFITILMRKITQKMWDYIKEQPGVLGNLQTRAVAVRYFLVLFLEMDVDYLLYILAEDFPEHQVAIQNLQTTQSLTLFGANAAPTQRLSILCDCVYKLGLHDIVVWLDLSGELRQLSMPLRTLLEDCFDSLYLMRQKRLHIKCLALPSVCQYLRQLRGIETLSAAMLELRWTHADLRLMVERRLQCASHQQIQSLAQVVDVDQFIALLEDAVDSTSPVEWITLMGMIVDAVNRQQQLPLTTGAWLSLQRAYYAERVKLRMDEQGAFWRGNRSLSELTPKKRAIYPLVRYLYENPGTHRTYNLLNILKLDETNLNTIISRARKEHLEPFPTSDGDETWIYLVTDYKGGGGYALRHTDRSP